MSKLNIVSSTDQVHNGSGLFFMGFSFIKMPKALFAEERYKDLKAEEIVLYSLMLNRSSLSAANGWEDETGETFEYFTIRSIEKALRCGHSKAVKHKQALQKAGLIRVRKMGANRPDRIYVLPFYTSEGQVTAVREADIDTAGFPHYRNSEVSETERNKTENNKNELNDINLLTDGFEGENVRAKIKENIEYDILAERGYDMPVVDNLVDIMTDEVCCQSEMVSMGRERIARSMVRRRFLKMDMLDIIYVLTCLEANVSKVRNVRAYIIKTLYYAQTTRMVQARLAVQHDMYQLSEPMMEGGLQYEA